MIALYDVGLQWQQQLLSDLALLLEGDQQLPYLVQPIVHAQSQLQCLLKLLEFASGWLGPEQVVVGLDELIVEVVEEGQEQRQLLIIRHHLLRALAILNSRLVILSQEVILRPLSVKLLNAWVQLNSLCDCLEGQR